PKAGAERMNIEVTKASLSIVISHRASVPSLPKKVSRNRVHGCATDLRAIQSLASSSVLKPSRGLT
ncbi:MAG: hypothetical protein WA813_22180, partial [Beijerinckiaceae bacterium]